MLGDRAAAQRMCCPMRARRPASRRPRRGPALPGPPGQDRGAAAPPVRFAVRLL